MIDSILIPALIVAALGAVFGIGLAVASHKLAVKTDERIPAVRDCLPGANCGGCGYPGCDAYAAAIVKDGAPVTLCAAGGASCAAGIAAVMGVEAGEHGEKKIANIICRGSSDKCGIRFDYDGERTCRAVAMTAEGDKACRYACVGYGDCAKACPFDAIHVGPDRIAYVDEEKCVGCGSCVAACPKNVIRIEPKYKVQVKCRALEKGKIVRDHCTAGCIGCGRCATNCLFGAITMENNLPVIDRDKCVGCLVCTTKCPTGAMTMLIKERPKAHIDADLCVGCTICAKQCKFDAILGELKQKHRVEQALCTGCGQCAAKCPKKAIVVCPDSEWQAKQ